MAPLLLTVSANTYHTFAVNVNPLLTVGLYKFNKLFDVLNSRLSLPKSIIVA